MLDGKNVNIVALAFTFLHHKESSCCPSVWSQHTLEELDLGSSSEAGRIYAKAIRENFCGSEMEDRSVYPLAQSCWTLLGWVLC